MSSESHNQIAVRGRMGEWDITPHIRTMSVTPLMENSFPIADVTLVGVENKYTARADSPLYSRPPILLEASKDGGNTFHTLLKGVVMEPEHTVGGDGSTLIRLRCQGGGCLTHLAINPNNVAMGGFWGVAELFRGSPLTGNRGGDGVWDQDEQGNFPNGLLYKTGYRYEGVEELFEDLPDVPATYAPTNYYVFDAIREVCDTYGLIFFIDDEDGAIRVLESPTIAPFPPHPTARFERGFNISTLNDANDHRRIYDKVLVLGEGVHYVKGEGHRVYIHRDTELSSIEEAMEVADKVYRRMVRVEDGPEWHQTVITAPPVVEKIVGRSAFIRDPSLSWEGYRNVVGLSHDISEGRWSSTITLESRQRTVPITLAEIMAKEDEKEGGEAQAILTVTDPILDSDVLTRFANPVGIQFRDRLSGAKLLKPHTDIDLSWDGKRYSSFDVIGSSEGLDTFTDMDFIFNDESTPGHMKRKAINVTIDPVPRDKLIKVDDKWYRSLGNPGPIHFIHSIDSVMTIGAMKDFPAIVDSPEYNISLKPSTSKDVGFYSTQFAWPGGDNDILENDVLRTAVEGLLPLANKIDKEDGWSTGIFSPADLKVLQSYDENTLNISLLRVGGTPVHNLGALLFRYDINDGKHIFQFLTRINTIMSAYEVIGGPKYCLAMYNFDYSTYGRWELTATPDWQFGASKYYTHPVATGGVRTSSKGHYIFDGGGHFTTPSNSVDGVPLIGTTLRIDDIPPEYVGKMSYIVSNRGNGNTHGSIEAYIIYAEDSFKVGYRFGNEGDLLCDVVTSESFDIGREHDLFFFVVIDSPEGGYKAEYQCHITVDGVRQMSTQTGGPRPAFPPSIDNSINELHIGGHPEGQGVPLLGEVTHIIISKNPATYVYHKNKNYDDFTHPDDLIIAVKEGANDGAISFPYTSYNDRLMEGEGEIKIEGTTDETGGFIHFGASRHKMNNRCISEYISPNGEIMIALVAVSPDPISNMIMRYSDATAHFYIDGEEEHKLRVLDKMELEVVKRTPITTHSPYGDYTGVYKVEYECGISPLAHSFEGAYLNAEWNPTSQSHHSPSGEIPIDDVFTYNEPTGQFWFNSRRVDVPRYLFQIKRRTDGSLYLSLVRYFSTSWGGMGRIPDIGDIWELYIDYSILYTTPYTLPPSQVFNPSSFYIQERSDGWEIYIEADEHAPSFSAWTWSSVNYFGGEVAARAEFRNPSRVPHGMDMIPFKEVLIQTEIDMDNVEQTHIELTPAQIMGLGCEEVGNKPDRRAE